MRWQQPGRCLAALTGAIFASGCFVRGGGGLQVSSLTSDYSPVVAFTAKVDVTDSVRVRIDRARVVAPGEDIPEMGAITGAIEMQALLVTENPLADMNRPMSADEAASDRNGSRKPWREQSVSNRVKIADSLRMGVAQTTAPLQFTLPLPPTANTAKSWLVFRISGESVALPARMADGSIAPMLSMPPIRVFACSTKNLDGRTNKERKRQMEEAYSAGC